MSQNRIPRVAFRSTLQSKADLKSYGEEQSRKILSQWVSRGVSRKWPLWSEFVGGREFRHHALRGAKSKKKRYSKPSILSCQMDIEN